MPKLSDVAAVCEFASGMVLVFDYTGHLIPDYCGARADVQRKLIGLNTDLVQFLSTDIERGTEGPHSMRARIKYETQLKQNERN